MYLVTSESMRAIDREAIDKHKIPSLELMEKAGQGIAERLLIHEIIDPASEHKVAVICGKGIFIISIRSRSTAGIGSDQLAVVINITLDRSKSISR